MMRQQKVIQTHTIESAAEIMKTSLKNTHKPQKIGHSKHTM